MRDNETFHRKIKRWRSNGLPWEQEEKKKAYDQNGHSLGLKKHGYWAIWNEDGTLQQETWYDMGKLLRQKRYEGGKLVEDKKYN
ncbi:prolyl endopeptidase [uncultured Microscilla sp.]|uniref:prolyl endopeptidase n=1 Tax=uncultured Microscilla sp. TaxID=432653 RepID=UPI0026274704|nr:prolyl endopeptidase [uncultured Microscilla sp.]